MKGNFEVIHFHIKLRSVQVLVFVQITFEGRTANFYFKNDDVGMKTKIATLKRLLVWDVSACFRIFMELRF